MAGPELDFRSEFSQLTYEAWQRLVEKALKGVDFDKRLVSRTADGIRIEPLYTRRDALPAVETAMPGSAPFTRGTAGQTARAGWEMRQLIAQTDAHEARNEIEQQRAGGAEGFVLALEAPGQAGLAIDLLAQTLGNVPLDRTLVALEAGESAQAAAEVLVRLWQSQGTPDASRRAAFNLDPIGALARHGGLSEPLPVAIQNAARFAGDARWSAGSVAILCADGRIAHEAGGSEAHELAAMLASLVTYLRAMEVEGQAPAHALPRIGIALAADADLFVTIAKLRAARRLVWRLADAAGSGMAAGQVKLAVTTSSRMMAQRDPWVNLLRTCAAGMAAALGGADALTIQPYSAALGQPDAFARRIARNMHVVLREESHLARVSDPAGGAWAIEKLTDELAIKAWAEFQVIEAAGGMVQALRAGLVQSRVAAAAGERAKAIATRRNELTGVSAFPKLGSDGVEVRPPPSPRQPAGAAERMTPLRPLRLAEPFERLRDQADAAIAKGKVARVFLASLGQLADHSARSTWIANMLAAGGIEAIQTEGFTNSAEVGRAFAESGTTVACICSSDAIYAELAEATAGALKQAGALKVYLAGRPKNEAELRAAGVDALLYAGQDTVAALTSLQADLAFP